MPRKRRHGGRRPGAGRPLLGDAAMTRRNVMIATEIDRLLLEAGSGNRSEGIRVVTQFWALAQVAGKNEGESLFQAATIHCCHG